MAPSVTKDDIRAAVGQLGIAGSPICVHASLRSFGWVEGGAVTIVQALLGAACSVLVPTFSYAFSLPPPDDAAMRPSRNGIDYASVPQSQSDARRVFSPESNELSIEAMGAVPAAVLAVPDRRRGNHPSNSFTAVGPLAHQLIDAQTPTDVYQPLQALARLDGWVVLMGVGLRSMTLLHLAEKLAGRQLFRYWNNDPEGNVMMVQGGGCSTGFNKFGPVFEHLERRITVGRSTWKAYPASAALDAAAQAIIHDPSITHCGNEECTYCRDAVAGGPLLPT